MAALRDLVAEELAEPLDPRVRVMAEAIAAKHAPASRAVLFYGSCLRQKQLEGLMLDFYLIVSDYRTTYGKSWLAAANRMIPPNVFYFEHDGLVAKYAVLSEPDFYRHQSSGASPSTRPADASSVGADRDIAAIAAAREASSAAQTNREGCANRAQTETLRVSGPLRR